MASVTEQEGVEFLEHYLTKTLRVSVSDKRVFVGQLKCTDKDCNVILALTQEYRPPPDEDIQAAAVSQGEGSAPLQLQFTNRYVGLVVIPGQYITKIEHEEWAA
ncbi:hypothetical protein NA57DRAFT_78823 [Rhizodiscina lignyota]|uniref:Sm domain-containing protein n=1 Tax=Rhizodiscina lignyota TaxID=1504668 RepID=A0A9P4IAY7_9PEZI|nr:hypothetical protein NA57DRAFT_78823 [Rhizodiscina lignyota]